MKPFRLAIGLFAAMTLLTSAAFAAPGPYAPGKAHEQRKSFNHHQNTHQHQQKHQHRYPPRQQQQRQPQGQSQWLWQNQREMHRAPPPTQHRAPPKHQHHRHPPHRDQLRRNIHRNSHYLRPAPPLPRHMHLIVGRPLPHGWSHRVPAGHLKHLPQYPGYEWHSAGRDLVLVAATTGVVYTILDNILN